MSSGNLKAGVAQATIDVRPGVTLAGHLAARRAQSVANALLAKALVLDDGCTQLGIVSLDLYGITGGTCERVARSLGDSLGWASEQLLLVASGTRGAPVTVPTLGTDEVHRATLDAAVSATTQAVTAARESLQEASLGAGVAYLPRLPFNRRLLTRNLRVITEWTGVPENEVLAPEGPVDDELTVLLLRDGRGFPLAILWSFAADPMFYESAAISAGLPHHVQHQVSERLGRQIPCLYLPGCGGNVGYNFDLERTSAELASAITAVTLETPCDPDVALAAAREEVVLPIKDYSRFWDEAEVEAKWPAGLFAYRREQELMAQAGEKAVPTVVQAMRLGAFGLAGLPGEPFVELGLAVEQASPFRRTLVAGNANDSIGYLPTEEALRHGGQETWLARFAKAGRGAGEFVAMEAADMLMELG